MLSESQDIIPEVFNFLAGQVALRFGSILNVQTAEVAEVVNSK